MAFDKLKRVALHYAIIALAVILLDSYIINFTSKYLPFLNGQIGIFILTFIAVFVIIVVVDLITERWLNI